MISNRLRSTLLSALLALAVIPGCIASDDDLGENALELDGDGVGTRPTKPASTNTTTPDDGAGTLPSATVTSSRTELPELDSDGVGTLPGMTAAADPAVPASSSDGAGTLPSAPAATDDETR